MILTLNTPDFDLHWQQSYYGQ